MFNLNKKVRCKLDTWDAIALVGFFAIVVGAGLIYLPAGLIVFGVGTLFAYYLRELGNSHVPVESPGERKDGKPKSGK